MIVYTGSRPSRLNLRGYLPAVALVAALVLISAACGKASSAGVGGSTLPDTTLTALPAGITASDITVTPDVNLTWINSTGLEGFNDGQWQQILVQACTAPIWDHAKGLALAAQVVSQAGGDISSQQVVQGAAEALWIGAAQACPDEFPAGVLKSGPGFVANGG